MDHILLLLHEHGLVIVFAAVLIERAGLPLPAFPVMLVAAAVAPPLEAASIALLATGAALPADLAWFWAGRRHGARILRALCRISLSPDSCVSQTQSAFSRWGPASLLVSSFVPGISAVAPPLAGASGQRLATFVGCDVLGLLLWSGSAVALGVLFRDAVKEVLATLETIGGLGLLFLVAALALFLGYKWRQRQRLIRELQMERISVSELIELVRSGRGPPLVDVRPPELRDLQGTIPGAIAYLDAALDSLAGSLRSAPEVVVYCACPNEVSAARVARELMNRGVPRVRPLRGGIDAWTTELRSVEVAGSAWRSGQLQSLGHPHEIRE